MIYQFADLELDTGRRQLSRNGDPVKLTRLSYKLLEALVEAAPNLLAPDQLVDKVWGPRRVLSTNSLSQRITMLRQSLGDDANSPNYIEGVRGQGYRLIPTVTPVDQSESPRPARPAPVSVTERSKRFIWFSITALACALTVAGIILWWSSGKDDYDRRVGDGGGVFNSVAVLPFASLSPDDSHSFYAAGIHEEVLNKLSKLTALKVISRTSMLRYADTREPIPKIARELAVDSLVEGTVRYANDRIRVTIQLVDGDSDVHLWSETYDRELKDIFEIESEIARDVAAALNQVVSEETARGPWRPPTDNLDAYAHYMQGRQSMLQRKPAELKAAVAHFKTATDLDPDFTVAWVGIADSLDLLAIYSFIPLEDTFEERQPAIDRALELDPLSGEAWLSLARLKDMQQLPEEAEKYYLRSIELNPGNAQAYHWYGIFLTHQGRSEEALPYSRRAVELDPVSPVVTGALSLTLRFLGRTEEAIVTERKNIELNPKFIPAYRNLIEMLSQAGRLDEAMYWAGAAVSADPSDPGARISKCFTLLNLGDDLAAEKCHQRLISDFPQATRLKFWPGLYAYREQYELLLTHMQEWNELDSSPAARVGLGYAYLNNRQVDQARAIFSQMWPQYFGTDEITMRERDLEPVVLAGVVLMLNGEKDRANYLFDKALLQMESMNRMRGRPFDRADIVIHVFRDDRSKAIAALREAIDSGWCVNWWRLRGPGFKAMDEEPAWRALNAELQADVKRQRENYQAHKDDPAYWR